MVVHIARKSGVDIYREWMQHAQKLGFSSQQSHSFHNAQMDNSDFDICESIGKWDNI